MNIGIAGSGMIVPDFLKAAAKVSEIEVKAICGREKSREKLERISSEYNIEKIYYDYDEMINRDEIETIYVAMPNNMHYEYAKAALNGGKNVILEKPFASNLGQAEELVKIAQEKRVYLFEAITNQYFPNYYKVKELVCELGDIKIVELNYSQYSSRYDSFKMGEVLPVFNPKMSGGALMDLNVYNIYFITGLFGQPDKIHYYANVEKDIDTSGILIMEYPKFKCTAIGAKDCKAPLNINIQGDKGYINSSSPANVFSEFTFARNDGNCEEFSLNEVKERLYYELCEFVKMTEEDDYDRNIEQMNHSLMVMNILDEARRQAGIEIQGL